MQPILFADFELFGVCENIENHFIGPRNGTTIDVSATSDSNRINPIHIKTDSFIVYACVRRSVHTTQIGRNSEYSCTIEIATNAEDG